MSPRAEVAPSRRALAVAVAVVATSVALFLLIAEDVFDGGGLISRDQAILTWFVDHRTDLWITVAKWASTVGSFVSLAVLGVLFAAFLWRRGPRRALALAPLVALVLASLASTAAKAFFDRERPPVAFRAATVTLASFPSGHATDAAAFFVAATLVLALTLARRRSSRLAVVAIGLLLASTVGLSRLVLGVHWLSDVVAGWALGAASAVAAFVTAWSLDAHRATGAPRGSEGPVGPDGRDGRGAGC